MSPQDQERIEPLIRAYSKTELAHMVLSQTKTFTANRVEIHHGPVPQIINLPQGQHYEVKIQDGVAIFSPQNPESLA